MLNYLTDRADPVRRNAARREQNPDARPFRLFHCERKCGRRLIVVGDDAGVALISEEAFEEKLNQAMELIYTQSDSE